MGIEDKELYDKVIYNIFNKIIAENLPNLKKELPFHVQEARISNRLDQSRMSPWHIIINTASTENKERILKVVRKKKNNV
jgi:hypothetical protein